MSEPTAKPCTCPAWDVIRDGWLWCDLCGKAVGRFPNTGKDWSGLFDVQAWLRANGYIIGPHSGTDSAGIHKGFVAPICRPAFMTPEQLEALDGRITWEDGDDPRTATAVVTLKAHPDVPASAA